MPTPGRMIWISLSLLTVLASTPLSAQTTEPAVSYEVGYFAPGIDPALGGGPIQSTQYALTQIGCGLPRENPAPVVTNPKRARWNDLADPTKDCEAQLASTVLPSLPIGTGYRAAIRARGATTVGRWGVLSNPFDVAKEPPPPPENARVL